MTHTTTGQATHNNFSEHAAPGSHSPSALMDHTVLDSISDAVFTFDTDRRLTYINSSFEKIFNIGKAEVLGRQLFEVLPALASSALLPAENSHTEQSVTFEEAIDGKWLRFTTYPSAGYVDVLVKDTTLEKEHRQAVEESDRLARIINKSPNVVMLTDVLGNITWTNEAFTRITEYTSAEAIGKKPDTLLQGPETSQQAISMIGDAMHQVESIRIELLNYSKTGRKYWADLKLEPVYLDNELTGYLGFMSDITQKKQDELAIKERNEKIGKVSFITSHELRHEFAKIMMLINESDSDDYSHEDLKALFRYLKEPAQLINSIISKINDNLKHEGDDIHHTMPPLPSVEEICLIEDDKLTNMINTRLIKKIIPSIPVKVFEDTESALETIKFQPSIPRLILLDLNLPAKSGWDFLEECSDIESTSRVLMLTSSIDPRDIERSKRYKMVEDYICKPLTVNVFEEYAKKYCAV